MNLPQISEELLLNVIPFAVSNDGGFRIHQPFSDAKVDVGNGRCNLHRVFDAGKLGLLSVANSALDFYSWTLELCQDVSTIVRKKLPTHCTRKKKHLTPQTQLLVHGSWLTFDIRGATEPGPQKNAFGCFWVSSYFDSEAKNLKVQQRMFQPGKKTRLKAAWCWFVQTSLISKGP